MNSTTPTSDNRQRRQHHQKSHNGCARCKSQHRKCDEARPSCGACRKRGLICSLSTPSVQSPINQERPLAINDLRFLHHWLKGDGVLFEDHEAKAGRQERDRQLELAFEHPYLLHTILSIAALEMFHNQPDNISLYEHASSHDLAAVRQARPHLSRSDPKHSEPLYLFSAFTSLYAFAEPPLRALSPEYCTSVDVLKDLLSAFKMGRGILAVSKANEDHLNETGQPNSALWPDETAEVMSTLHDDFSQLGILLELVDSHFKESQNKNVIEEAVTRLFAIISLLQRRPKNHSSARLIQTWPMHVDASLLGLWEAQDPVALVILAHYAVLINQRVNLWFFQRWPPLLFEYIRSSISEQWCKYLDWPRHEILES